MPDKVEIVERWQSLYTITKHPINGRSIALGEIRMLIEELSRAEQLLEQMAKALEPHAVTMTWDYPAETPVECGLWCSICSVHVEANGVGHTNDCLFTTYRAWKDKQNADTNHSL